MAAATHNGERRDIVALAASLGGFEALRKLLAALPSDFPGSILAVLHRSPFVETKLADLIKRRTDLDVVDAQQGDEIEPGRVYIAPRDHHMIVGDDRLWLNRGPKQHHTRPAADPLFLSAAQAYGRRVVGVVLTGYGADGVEGLVAIKSEGGVAIVQDPEEAPAPSMPRKAIIADDVDFVLRLSAIPTTLIALANGKAIADAETAGR
ncbi:MAG: chemotaxis protein CheB [Candidatus Binatia bacterium]